MRTHPAQGSDYIDVHHDGFALSVHFFHVALLMVVTSRWVIGHSTLIAYVRF